MISSLVIGNTSIDILDDSTEQLGGSVAYVSNLLVKADQNVTVISSFGRDYPTEIFDPSIKSIFSLSNVTTKFKVSYKDLLREMCLVSRADHLDLRFLKRKKIHDDVIFFVPILDEINILDTKDILRNNKDVFSASIPQGWIRNFNQRKIKIDFSLLSEFPCFDLIFFSHEEISSAKIDLSILLKLSKILVITHGDKGSTIFSSNKTINIPAHKAKVIDSIGAGDVYAGIFIDVYLKTKNLEKAGKAASKISSKSTEISGLEGLKNYLKI